MTYTQNATRPGFDRFRPQWLADPAFVPVDVDAADLVHPHDALRDMTRPELGGFVPVHHDDIDQPYDHRVHAQPHR
jgi:hypothetical protein